VSTGIVVHSRFRAQPATPRIAKSTGEHPILSLLLEPVVVLAQGRQHFFKEVPVQHGAFEERFKRKVEKRWRNGVFVNPLLFKR
jgi:hypothetical protein